MKNNSFKTIDTFKIQTVAVLEKIKLTIIKQENIIWKIFYSGLEYLYVKAKQISLY